MAIRKVIDLFILNIYMIRDKLSGNSIRCRAAIDFDFDILDIKSSDKFMNMNYDSDSFEKHMNAKDQIWLSVNPSVCICTIHYK